jgi:hypothetical protein
VHHLKTLVLCGLALAAAGQSAQANPQPPLARFNGSIGVDPVASLNTATTNVVRGINPGGRHWVLRKFKAAVGANGRLWAKGSGLLFGSGELIGTRGAVTHVAATLACGPADATARKFSTAPSPLDLAGDFDIRDTLSEDGVNAAVLPPTCDNPVLLIRSANPTTGVLGNWFAAGIPDSGDDD